MMASSALPSARPPAWPACLQIETEKKTFDEAYGAVIGTYCVCALLEMGIAFLPKK